MRYCQVVHVGGFGGGVFERPVEAEAVPRADEFVVLGVNEARAKVSAVIHAAHLGVLVSMRAPFKVADETPQQRAESIKALGFRPARKAVEKVVMG